MCACIVPQKKDSSLLVNMRHTRSRIALQEKEIRLSGRVRVVSIQILSQEKYWRFGRRFNRSCIEDCVVATILIDDKSKDFI